MKSEAKQQDEDGDKECDDAGEDSGEIHKPVTSIVVAYRLLTPSIKVLIWYWVPFTYWLVCILVDAISSIGHKERQLYGSNAFIFGTFNEI
jgi:hypothetical protein